MQELFILLFFFLSFFSSPSHSADDIYSFVYAGCSEPKYVPGTPYQYNLNSLLASLANAAAMSNFNKFTSSLASSSSPIYGLYQCRGDLSITSCESCVRSAINQLSALCSSSTGAALQLRGCLIRYGNDTFIGQPDKTLLYKKCGSGTGGGGYDTDLLGMRDSVLQGLVAGQGTYRLGRAGYVDGTAQCVGDQNYKQCNDCVSEAVANIRSQCTGPAVSGEVYLGKCYAQYSSRGVYASKTDHADEAGKEVAIIVGIAAAVLLLILLLYFLSKSAAGKGK